MSTRQAKRSYSEAMDSLQYTNDRKCRKWLSHVNGTLGCKFPARTIIDHGGNPIPFQEQPLFEGPDFETDSEESSIEPSVCFLSSKINLFLLFSSQIKRRQIDSDERIELINIYFFALEQERKMEKYAQEHFPPKRPVTPSPPYFLDVWDSSSD
jgi:hypothetical protein